MKLTIASTGARHLVLEGQRGNGSRRLVLLASASLLLAGVAGSGWVLWRELSPGVSAARQIAAERAVPDQPGIALPPPDLFRPLSPLEAMRENAERPLSDRPDSAASQFVLRSDAISRLRAVECLAQAVYYEAASEGVDGGRAVAQVVLNRVRHPAYPNSVCGVVYQGWQRRTGCQFSFTCDGSMARVPSAYLWQRSLLIAREALAGRVFAPVGHATHYHADYVLPYWADSLDKVAVIRRHIFYRLRGQAGASEQFRQRYAGVEPLPPAPPSDVLETEILTPVDATELPSPIEEPKVEEDRISPLAEGEKVNAPEPVSIEADLARGTLILGEPAPPASKDRPKRSAPTSDRCAEGSAKRIEPLGAEQLKAGSGQPSC